MNGVVANVQIWHPGAADGQDDYWVNGEGARLAGLYGELLGMRLIDVGYKKLVNEDGRLPEIGFEDAPDDARAHWPDPERPQQVHLDLEVGDLDAAEGVALQWGATPLQDKGEFRTYADAVGHPFCLYLSSAVGAPLPGRIARIVIDCFSPRALASFYEEFLDIHTRTLDTPERVEISGMAAGDVVLAFQHAQFAPARWPDPAHPAQVHLDLSFDDVSEAQSLAELLGAIRLSVSDSHSVYADPASHPFCLGESGPWPSGPAQVDAYRDWLASRSG